MEEGDETAQPRDDIRVQITSLSTRSAARLLPEPDDDLDDDLPSLPIAVTATATATAFVGPSSSGVEAGSHSAFPDMVGLKRGPGTSPGCSDEGAVKRSLCETYEGKTATKMFQMAQSKLIEHGFPALDDAQILQAGQELECSPSGSAVQFLLQEACKRVVDVLDQYGQRGQLVQELILSTETAMRRNERLAVDNKELALQITEYKQSTSADDKQKIEDRLRDQLREMEITKRDAVARRECVDEDIKQLHAKMIDIRQDLAVSLKREAGLSAELRRIEQEHAAERHRLEGRLEAMHRKEMSVISLVEEKERRLEQCQERLRSVVEEEERRREEALTVLKTFPRRNAHASTTCQRRGASTVGGGGGAWASDMRAAAVVASLMDQIHFQDKEMAVLRKENNEIASNVRQLLSRVPQASRANPDVARSGGVSASSSPVKDLHAGPRSPSKSTSHTSNTHEVSPPHERTSGGSSMARSAGREAELLAGHSAIVQELQRSKRAMNEMSGALREAEERMGRANATKDGLLNRVRLLEGEVRRYQARDRETEKGFEWSTEQERMQEALTRERHSKREMEEKVQRVGRELHEAEEKVESLERELRDAKQAQDSHQREREEALAQEQERDRLRAQKRMQEMLDASKMSSSIMQDLRVLLKVPGAEIVPAVRQLIRLAEQVDEVRARASDAALAIQILAQVEETLNSRVASAVTTLGGGGTSPAPYKSGRTKGDSFRVEPHDVVLEVQELVAFETRWLTDALVNQDAKGMYEVSFRAISRLQEMVAGSDPDDTLSRVSVYINQRKTHLTFMHNLCSLLHIPGRDSGLEDLVRCQETVLFRISSLQSQLLVHEPERTVVSVGLKPGVGDSFSSSMLMEGGQDPATIEMKIVGAGKARSEDADSKRTGDIKDGKSTFLPDLDGQQQSVESWVEEQGGKAGGLESESEVNSMGGARAVEEESKVEGESSSQDMDLSPASSFLPSLPSVSRSMISDGETSRARSPPPLAQTSLSVTTSASDVSDSNGGRNVACRVDYAGNDPSGSPAAAHVGGSHRRAAPVAWELLIEEPEPAQHWLAAEGEPETGIDLAETPKENGRKDEDGDGKVEGKKKLSVRQRVAIAREIYVGGTVPSSRLPVTTVQVLPRSKQEELEEEKEERQRVLQGQLQTACYRHLKSRARNSIEPPTSRAIAWASRASAAGGVPDWKATKPSEREISGRGAREISAKIPGNALGVPAAGTGGGGAAPQKAGPHVSGKGRLKAPRGLAPPTWGGKGEAPGIGRGGILQGWIGEAPTAGGHGSEAAGTMDVKLVEEGAWIVRGGRPVWVLHGSNVSKDSREEGQRRGQEDVQGRVDDVRREDFETHGVHGDARHASEGLAMPSIEPLPDVNNLCHERPVSPISLTANQDMDGAGAVALLPSSSPLKVTAGEIEDDGPQAGPAGAQDSLPMDSPPMQD